MVVRLDSLLESVAEYLDISIVVTNDKDSDRQCFLASPSSPLLPACSTPGGVESWVGDFPC